jgi:hypothetical protein
MPGGAVSPDARCDAALCHAEEMCCTLLEALICRRHGAAAAQMCNTHPGCRDYPSSIGVPGLQHVGVEGFQPLRVSVPQSVLQVQRLPLVSVNGDPDQLPPD